MEFLKCIKIVFCITIFLPFDYIMPDKKENVKHFFKKILKNLKIGKF
jgi:hypothetical protein